MLFDYPKTAPLPKCPMCRENPVPVLAGQRVVLCATCMADDRPSDAFCLFLELHSARVEAHMYLRHRSG